LYSSHCVQLIGEGLLWVIGGLFCIVALSYRLFGLKYGILEVVFRGGGNGVGVDMVDLLGRGNLTGQDSRCSQFQGV
jgi:hypothetical protein